MEGEPMREETSQEIIRILHEQGERLARIEGQVNGVKTLQERFIKLADCVSSNRTSIRYLIGIGGGAVGILVGWLIKLSLA